MQPETILKSDLLDILFENRNKDYGAYTLRREYAGRMNISLAVTFSFVALLLLFSLSIKTNPLNVKPIIVNIPPLLKPPPKQNVKKPNQPKKQILSKHLIQPAAAIKEPTKPTVVPDKQADTKIPTTDDANNRDISDINKAEGRLTGQIDNGNQTGSNNNDNPKQTDKTVAIDNADISPEFPGGVDALKHFLEKNLNKPDNMDDGQEINVQVRFIVNYDGTIRGFEVIKSGGNEYDNEVLRVLKKMPHWIPGKSNGQNVSVYYVVPVKFIDDGSD